MHIQVGSLPNFICLLGMWRQKVRFFSHLGHTEIIGCIHCEVKGVSLFGSDLTWGIKNSIFRRLIHQEVGCAVSKNI